MKRYRKVEYTIDERTVGKKGSSFTVEIILNFFLTYKREFNKSIFNHLDNFKKAKDFSSLPSGIEGKLVRRKKPIDVMSNSPHFFGLRFIVSEKFKEVFEDLGIKDSYFKQIHLRKFDSNFYLFLNPITDYHVIDFEKSRFFKQVGM